MSQPNPQPVAKSDQTIWIYLAYLLQWIFGLIGLAVVKDDENVRFHCAQSFVFWVLVMIANIILSITVILPFIIVPAAYIYAIIVMIKASKGEKVKMPICGDFAEKNVMGWFK